MTAMSYARPRCLPTALRGNAALRGIAVLGVVFVAAACGPAGATVSSAPTSRTEEALAQKDACPLDAADVSPHPAPSRQVALPAVPQMEPLVLLYEDDDAFTVAGAAYQLRSDAHRASVTQREIAIRGIIAKTTLPDAPKCSVHATGIADPYDCRAEVPAFWLCDGQHDPLNKCIKVMGWASNNAQIYDALKEYDIDVSTTVTDSFWGVALPKPLPAVGANVRAVGTYGTTFTRSAAGTDENDFMGILTAYEVITHTEGPELATLPGVKRKPRP